MKYEPGDVALVVPQNLKENIDKVLNFFEFDNNNNNNNNITRKTVIKVYTKDGHIPDGYPKTELTIEELFTKYLDICSRPTRYVYMYINLYLCYYSKNNHNFFPHLPGKNKFWKKFLQTIFFYFFQVFFFLQSKKNNEKK